MARNSLTCDICGKPTNRVVAKLFLAPTPETSATERKRVSTHSDYTAHADVGECCASRAIVKEVKWQKRRKYREYRRAVKAA